MGLYLKILKEVGVIYLSTHPAVTVIGSVDKVTGACVDIFPTSCHTRSLRTRVL